MTDIELILGNSNKRFSGVTSTMLQVLKHQQHLIPTAVLGKHYVPESVPVLSFWQMVKMCREPLPDGRYRVFHARRNDEMIQALTAKKVFGAKIKIAFTSTAQRHHSGFTTSLMGQMDAIISTCEAAASYLEKHPADVIISHGVDTVEFSPPTSKCEAWAKTGFPGEFGIGIFGRVRASKGHDVFIEAALPVLQQFPQATVVICGECVAKDESFKQQLQKQIDQAGLSERVIFLGKRPFSEIPGLFQAMSLVVALSRNEGFGLTPLEAMSSGCAVLTSEAGAWKEVVQNGVVGYCVETGNVSAVREQLHMLLSDPEIMELMGKAGRELVLEKYDVKREAQELTEFLRGLA